MPKRKSVRLVKTPVYGCFLNGKYIWKATGVAKALKKCKISRTAFFKCIREGKTCKYGMTYDIIGYKKVPRTYYKYVMPLRYRLRRALLAFIKEI